HSAKRPPTDDDLPQTQAERDSSYVTRILHDVVGGMASRSSHTAVGKPDDLMPAGKCVNECVIPRIQRSPESVAEDNRIATSHRTIRQLAAFMFDELRLRCQR